VDFFSLLHGIVIDSFTVEKQHHRMSWLRQQRVLILTATLIKNCKPGNPPVATKSFLISDVTAVLLKDKENLSIQLTNEHQYFYKSDAAFEIAWEIRKRIAAHNAAATLGASQLLSPEAVESLCNSFCSGDLQLPQCSKVTDLEIDAPQKVGSTVVEARARSKSIMVDFITLKMEMMFVIRSGKLPGADDIAKVVRQLGELDVDFIDFTEVREMVDGLKGPLVEQLLLPEGSRDKAKGIPFASSDVMAGLVAEDVLEVAVIEPLYDKLWEALTLQSGVAGMENALYHKCTMMKSLPADGVDEAILGLNYTLVLKQLQSLVKQRTPSQMLDVLVNIAKLITLTIRGAAQDDVAQVFVLSPELDSPQPDGASPSQEGKSLDSPQAPKRSSIHALAADDVLPLYIHLLVHSEVRGLVLVREWIQRLGDPNECSERTYFFTMFASAIEYISSKVLPGKLDSTGSSSPPGAPRDRSKSASPYSSPATRAARSATLVCKD
jgi:hypothetical protein